MTERWGLWLKHLGVKGGKRAEFIIVLQQSIEKLLSPYFLLMLSQFLKRNLMSFLLVCSEFCLVFCLFNLLYVSISCVSLEY